MGVQLFTNGASSTLSGTLSQGGTTMTLAAGTGSKFPSVTGSDFFLVTLFTKDVGGVEQNIEVVKVTARVGDTLTIVRDFENITGQSGGFAYDGTATTVFVHLRWTAASAGGMLQKSGNLAGLTDIAAARASLGIDTVYITAANATTSLIAAIDANLTGGTIFITKGVHDISSEITISGSGIHIIGDAGAVLRRLGAFPIFKVTGSNNTIENLKLDGNRAAYPYPARPRATIVDIRGDGNTVTRCVVENSNSHGILFPAAGAPDSNIVYANNIRNCDEIGIAHDSGTDNRILNNWVSGCGYEAVTLDQGAYRCIVSDNRLNANCQTGGVGSIGVDGTDLCVIANNVITGTLSGLSGITFQNNLGSSNLNVIADNVLDSNEGYGIKLKTGTGGSCSNNTITGNVLRSNNTLGSIKIGSGCQGNVLRGNHYGVLPDIDPLSYNQVEPGLVFFYAKNTVARTDVTGDNTSYQIPFDTITQNRNIGSSFNTTTGVFTAPITGLYQLSAGVRTSGGGLHDFLVLQLVTTGGIFANGVDYTDEGAQECAVSGTIFIRKGEAAYVSVRVGGDTKTVDITSEGNHNYFTGCLIG
jgi:hypothetical protein